MDRLKQIEELNQFLLEEMPRYREQAAQFPHTVSEQRRLLRSLMNLRPPMPLDPAFLRPQDKLLSTEREEKGVVDGDRLPGTPSDQRLALWQGDITRLKVDAIVDAGNSALLGCFCPCHGCIDNAIHSFAGIQLRLACDDLMRAQGYDEPVGRAKTTPAFNLPASFIVHTVGPNVSSGVPTAAQDEQLASCYRACLNTAADAGCTSLAFCCISTGEFRFPRERAARIAVDEARAWLACDVRIERIVFDVFDEEDFEIYDRLLKA